MEATSSHPQSSNIGYRMPVFLTVVSVLIFLSFLQYRNVLIELHQLAKSDLYQVLQNADTPPENDKVYGLHVALIRSQTTASLGKANGEAQEANVATWEGLLSRHEFSYDVLDRVPELDDAYAYNLMVLPAVTALDQAEISAVKAFLRSGRGLLMTWSCGTQNEHGQWKKYSLMQEVAGVEPAGLPPELEGELAGMKMLKTQVLSAGVPSGMTVAMSRYDQPISARVLEERSYVDGVWSLGGAHESRELFMNARDRAAMVHGEYLGGRYVWTGFTMNSSIGIVEQANALQATVRESMLWAGRQIRVVKPSWPGGQPSALSISQNLRVTGGIDQELIEIARAYNVPVTSYVGREIIEQVPQALHKLEAAGEVGLLIDPEIKSETTVRNLRKMRKSIKSVLGTAPVGCRVDGEINANLALALVKAGFSYVSSTDYDRLVPKVLRAYRPVAALTRPRYLWALPEMRCDSLGATGMSEDMFVHMTEALTLGGYCCLSFDAAEVDAETPDHLRQLLQLARDEKVWTTTAREVAQTWSWWDNIKISTKPIGEYQASVQVSNTGLIRAPRVDLTVHIANPALDMEMDAMTLGVDLPRVSTVDGSRWTMKFDDIRAGKNLAYKIRFTGADGTASAGTTL